MNIQYKTITDILKDCKDKFTLEELKAIKKLIREKSKPRIIKTKVCSWCEKRKKVEQLNEIEMGFDEGITLLCDKCIEV